MPVRRYAAGPRRSPAARSFGQTVTQSPFWIWDKKSGATNIGGEGFLAAISGDGRVVGGSVGVNVDTPYGPTVQERAALWTKQDGWTSIAPDTFAG